MFQEATNNVNAFTLFTHSLITIMSQYYCNCWCSKAIDQCFWGDWRRVFAGKDVPGGHEQRERAPRRHPRDHHRRRTPQGYLLGHGRYLILLDPRFVSATVFTSTPWVLMDAIRYGDTKCRNKVRHPRDHHRRRTAQGPSLQNLLQKCSTTTQSSLKFRSPKTLNEYCCDEQRERAPRRHPRSSRDAPRLFYF